MGRAGVVAQPALRSSGRWTSLADGVVAGALSVVVLGFWVASSPASGLATVGLVCALASVTTVAWRSRAPGAAVIVAGAGAVGCEWSTRTPALQHHDLVVGLAVLLAMYSAGVRGISRRQIAQLAVLVFYGMAVCAIFTAVTGSLSVSNVVEYALPIAVVPALAGLLVARQRSLAARLAAATARLQAGEEMRLALAAAGERNRVARELHDVVAHAVSVMVVQAGAARVTVAAELDLARAALREVIRAGRAALAELRRIIGPGGHDDDSSRFGMAGIAALIEGRRAAGLAVQLTVTGGNSGVPAVDGTIYRLVQEALTNITKHAPGAQAEVKVAIEPGTAEVLVRNTPPTEPAGAGVCGAGVCGAGQGLTGMRERVESCGGQLSYGPRPDGGFEILARIPVTATGPEPPYSPRRPNALMGRVRRLGPWPGVVIGMCVLGADAYASPDRGQPLALNVVLAAGLALPLIWRRRFPVWFLVAVNLLALPISNSVASDGDLFWVSTYVFVVPVWTVAVWSSAGPAVTGLVLAAGFNLGECLYWQAGGISIAANLLFNALLWFGGRVARSQRLLAADLSRVHSRLEAEQQARELLHVAAERTRLVGRLHSLVAGQVSDMIVAAESTENVIGVDPGASAASIAAIEQTGREALVRLREILGLLRAEHDPEPLAPLLGVGHLHDLVARYRQPGRPAGLDVSGAPVPLPGGLDLLAYRIVEEVLAAAGETASSAAVSLRFGANSLGLDFVLGRPLADWAHPGTRAEIQRTGGSIRRVDAGAGEHITVELPLAPALASP